MSYITLGGDTSSYVDVPTSGYYIDPTAAGITGPAGPSIIAAQSAFGAVSGTTVPANSLEFRMNPVSGSVWPQVRGNSSTPVINYSGIAILNSIGSTGFSNGSTTLSNSSWTNFLSDNMSSAGDSAVINIQDQTNSFIYRATFIRGTVPDGSGGSGSIIIEQLL